MSSIRSDVRVDVIISSSSVLLAGSYTSTTAMASTGPANQRNYREDLSVKNMMQNRHLAKAIGDAGWSGLVAKVRYKLERNGGHLVTIDCWFPSSKTCAVCRAVADALSLSKRCWPCASCGTRHDRDVNAAQNVLQQGVLQLKAAGLNVSACGGVRNAYAIVGCSL